MRVKSVLKRFDFCRNRKKIERKKLLMRKDTRKDEQRRGVDLQSKRESKWNKTGISSI